MFFQSKTYLTPALIRGLDKTTHCDSNYMEIMFSTDYDTNYGFS